MKRFTFLAVFFILATLAFSAEVGEKTYKEVTVNGKTLSKWVEVLSISEYDNNGNLIHFKDRYGKEEWNEYDSNGNLIHVKDSDGDERWGEYTYWKNGKIKIKTVYCTF